MSKEIWEAEHRKLEIRRLESYDPAPAERHYQARAKRMARHKCWEECRLDIGYFILIMGLILLTHG